MTRAQLKRTARDATLTATLLRQPGYHALGQGERERIADLLHALATFAMQCVEGDDAT